MRRYLNKYLLRHFGYQICRLPQMEFSIGKINYQVDPGSVGKTPQGEMTARGCIRMIEAQPRRHLKVLDICCGVGIIGLTIFSELAPGAIVSQIAFADINVFNINSLARTLKLNQLDSLIGDKIHYWLSDGLQHIPHQQFDIIVSNPPHIYIEEFSRERLSAQRLGTFDAGWQFHKSFYQNCHHYLAPDGEVWFLEYGKAAQPEDFLPYIEQNSHLSYRHTIPEPLDNNFFWMISANQMH